MRVLILGGGYAGLLVSRKLESKLPDDVDLTLVDETGEHLVQHELHKAIRDPEFVDSISIPLTELLDRTAVEVGTVTDVDRDAREVSVSRRDGDEDGGENEVFEYDVVAVCLGAETADYGIPGVAEHGVPMKRLEHAARVRREFEAVVDSGGGTVVVGGAGLSGVQVAGELAEFARGEGVSDHVDVVLVEQRESVAPEFPANFREAVRDQLDGLDVTVRTDCEVTRATADMVVTDDDEILTDLFVWTGGIRGPDVFDGDRPQVRDTLRLDERTFVLGDAGTVVDADGERVPATAQAAVRASPVAAANIAETVAELRGESYDPSFERWRFESPGWLVSVGDGAVAQLGPQVFTGPLAKVIKSSVGITYLAEHGSLRRALSVLRDEIDADNDLVQTLRERR